MFLRGFFNKIKQNKKQSKITKTKIKFNYQFKSSGAIPGLNLAVGHRSMNDDFLQMTDSIQDMSVKFGRKVFFASSLVGRHLKHRVDFSSQSGSSQLKFCENWS